MVGTVISRKAASSRRVARPFTIPKSWPAASTSLPTATGAESRCCNCWVASAHRRAVAQQLPLFLSNVHDYLAGGLTNRGELTQEEQRQSCVAALRRARLSHLIEALDSRLTDLTPVDRKCLSLIRALGRDPPLICLDELTAGLDDEASTRNEPAPGAARQPWEGN